MVATDLLSVHIYLNDTVSFREVGGGHPGADRQHYRVVFDDLSHGRVLHLWNTYRQVVPICDGAFAFRGGDDRRLKMLGESRQRRRRLGGGCASASPDHYLTGRICQELGCFSDAASLGHQLGVDSRLQQVYVGFLAQRIGRYFDLHRARSTGFELVERLVDGLWDIHSIDGPCSPLRHRLHRFKLIVDLVQHASIDADEVLGYLTRHQKHGG